MAERTMIRSSVHRLDESAGIQIASLVARIVLGSVMLIAGAEKITALEQFAANINAYEMLPLSLVNIAALVFVWNEIAVGILLLVGAAVRGAALVSGVLLIVFIVAIGWAMANNLDIDCGCFQASPRATAAPTQTLAPDPSTPAAPAPAIASPGTARDSVAQPVEGGQEVGWAKIFEDIGFLALAIFLIWYPKSYLTADRSLRKEGLEEATA